ncbi:MAG: hypothetical protein ACFFC1_21140 [Promethearchaeota archaeon]
MSLKCPICGEEYFHDSKICHKCENNSDSSGLIVNDESKSIKWNCGIFLEMDTLTFGKHKPDDEYIKINSEPKFTDFKPKKEYTWNCNSQIRYRNFFILKSEISRLKRVKKLPYIRYNIPEKESINSLIYE